MDNDEYNVTNIIGEKWIMRLQNLENDRLIFHEINLELTPFKLK